MTKYIHAFSDPITDEIDQSLIGNKGYNLCLMHGMDLPIPEGFIINAKAAKEFKKNVKLLSCHLTITFTVMVTVISKVLMESMFLTSTLKNNFK